MSIEGHQSVIKMSHKWYVSLTDVLKTMTVFNKMINDVIKRLVPQVQKRSWRKISTPIYKDEWLTMPDTGSVSQISEKELLKI